MLVPCIDLNLLIINAKQLFRFKPQKTNINPNVGYISVETTEKNKIVKLFVTYSYFNYNSISTFQFNWQVKSITKYNELSVVKLVYLCFTKTIMMMAFKSTVYKVSNINHDNQMSQIKFRFA